MRLLPIVAAVLLALAALPASAQLGPGPEGAEGGQARRMERIDVIRPSDVEERRRSTAAKIVVNRDELLKQGDTTLMDALKRLPGVSVGGSGGRGSDIRMRGMGGGYTQILVNGERPPPGFNLEELSPDVIERVEILRSATAEFSTQAVAGTINIVLRQALAQKSREFKQAVSVSNGEPATSTTVQFGDGFGRLAYTVPITLNTFRFRNHRTHEQRGFDSEGDLDLHYLTVQDHEGHGRNLSTAPKLQWTLPGEQNLSVDVFANMNRFKGQFPDVSTTFIGAGPTYDSSENRFEQEFVASRVNATWTRRGEGSRTEIRVGFNYNHRDAEFIAENFDEAGRAVLDRIVTTSGGDTGFTTMGKYSAALVEGHYFTFGWDAQQSRRTEDRFQQDTALAPGYREFDIDESYKAEVLRAAFFGQDEWDVTDRLSAYLGLRWEGIETRSQSSSIPQVKSTSSVWSPIAQVLWKVPGSEKDQVRAALARTYKAPNTFELLPRRFIVNNNTPTTPDFSGNPNLKPELSLGLDLAYEHYFTGGGIASVSFYFRRVEDIILRELVEIDGTFLSRPTNLGKANVRGIELDTKFNLRRFGIKWLPATDIRANLAFNDSEVDFLPGPHNRLADQTRMTANVGFDHRMQQPPVAFGGTFGYRTGGFIRSSFTQLAYSSPVRSLDFYAVYRFSPKMLLRVFASNLLAQDTHRVDAYSAGGRLLELTNIQDQFRRFGAQFEWRL
ncbi:MAG TPA: TonB-dependent receptor [Usitatibacter sp.]|nr:TonB-dependent receptor [Usitatibacter sp.]